MKTQEYWIKELNLLPHQEGGYFRETGRSKEVLEGTQRALFSNILFLLTEASPSHFHRLDAAEVWYYHAGESLTIHCIYTNGIYEAVKLGLDTGELLQFEVPKGTIFGSSVDKGYALVSCMVAPAFDYEKFELFTQKELLEQYPEHEVIIKKMALKKLP